MVAERILSHGLDGKIRDVLELSLLNNVLGGGALDGRSFSYENQLATCADRTTIRKSWFATACCPPNLARTMGMLGGYMWNAIVYEKTKTIEVSVYLYVAATRTIPLPGGGEATIRMTTQMPWTGGASWEVKAPNGWSWRLNIPCPAYASNVKVSIPHQEKDGFLQVEVKDHGTVQQHFDLTVRLMGPHPRTGQDTLAVTRGPIVYTVESSDNANLEKAYPHFEGVGLSSKANFTEQVGKIHGCEFVELIADNGVFALEDMEKSEPYRAASRKWKKVEEKVTFIPWFARGNSGGAGHIRTMLPRVN